MKRSGGKIEFKKSYIYTRNFFEKCQAIDAMAREWKNDLRGYEGTLAGMDRLVKDLIAIYKTEKGEVFQRPALTLESFGDCDDQTICMAGFFQLHNWDYEYVFLGQRNVTHISQMIEKNGEAVLVDCLPYKLPNDAKIFARIRGYMFDWHPREGNGTLLGPMAEKYRDSLLKAKEEYLKAYQEMSKQVIESRYYGVTEEGDHMVNATPAQIEREAAAWVGEQMRNFDPVALDLIEPEDIEAFQAEMAQDKAAGDAERSRDDKEEKKFASRHALNNRK